MKEGKKITQEKDKIKFEPKNQFKVMILGIPLNPYKINLRKAK